MDESNLMISIEDKLATVRMLEKGENIEDIADMFEVSVNTITKWSYKEDEMIKQININKNKVNSVNEYKTEVTEKSNHANINKEKPKVKTNKIHTNGKTREEVSPKLNKAPLKTRRRNKKDNNKDDKCKNTEDNSFSHNFETSKIAVETVKKTNVDTTTREKPKALKRSNKDMDHDGKINKKIKVEKNVMKCNENETETKIKLKDLYKKVYL